MKRMLIDELRNEIYYLDEYGREVEPADYTPPTCTRDGDCPKGQTTQCCYTVCEIEEIVQCNDSCLVHDYTKCEDYRGD